jgi:hypothetical protein
MSAMASRQRAATDSSSTVTLAMIGLMMTGG